MVPLLSIVNLHVKYRVNGKVAHAVRGVTLRVEEGEVLGIIGESGCGKSTLLSAIVRVLPPNSIVEGEIIFEGVDLLKLPEREMNKYRWNKIAYIPQNALSSLNPYYPIIQQVAEVLVYKRGMKWREARRHALHLLLRAGLPRDAAFMYPHQLSGGMIQRVLLAMALALEPKLILADEPTTALDVIVQGQILNLLKQLKRDYGFAMIISSHDISVISEIADKIAVMYAGELVEYGPADKVIENPRHPYTQLLLQSVPRLRGPKQRLEGIPGRPLAPFIESKGCPFADRCPFAMEKCHSEKPGFFEPEDGHLVKCWMYEEMPTAI